MKNKLIKKLKLSIVTCLAIFPVMQQANAACDVGPVIFRDTLFGAGLGLGVGALVLVANQNSNNIAANLATATLIGTGVGAVVGIVELSLSDCNQKHTLNKEKPGFQASPLLTLLPENKAEVDIKTESSSDFFQVEKLNQLAMGVSLSYSF
ncbi:hypothetical protein QEJ31_04285 [Pigmentibacter sp. JX0631]|uniref:hypothetical protein n=1 Tax=Pigmentibacter sp. JX0631 TaxID=2976982 RepID=UPI002468B95C|nr:hypothetical protein [Pigmentibacter sp. JX0631]WGL60814.1 hypothetical protein QEJ31_04285 [Pigmentibacter sp. JX0631]